MHAFRDFTRLLENGFVQSPFLLQVEPGNGTFSCSVYFLNPEDLRSELFQELGLIDVQVDQLSLSKTTRILLFFETKYSIARHDSNSLITRLRNLTFHFDFEIIQHLAHPVYSIRDIRKVLPFKETGERKNKISSLVAHSLDSNGAKLERSSKSVLAQTWPAANLKEIPNKAGDGRNLFVARKSSDTGNSNNVQPMQLEDQRFYLANNGLPYYANEATRLRSFSKSLFEGQWAKRLAKAGLFYTGNFNGSLGEYIFIFTRRITNIDI